MNDKLETYFKNHQNKFDIEEPSINHFKRFEKKLMNVKQPKIFTLKKWSIISIAASIVLFIGIGIGSSFPKNNLELADVSPKMEETQNYFAAVIVQELEKVSAQKTTFNQHVISDALDQLKILENKYQELTIELYESHQDQRIIFAMISNFQQRILILETLLNQLETINQLKSESYEKHV